MIRRALILPLLVCLPGSAFAQDASDTQESGKASWAGKKTPQAQRAVPLAKHAAQTRRLDAFERAKPKISQTTEDTARRAAERAQSRAATPMIVNTAKAAIEVAQPNLNGAKAGYEAELLEQFGFTPEAEVGQDNNAPSPPGRVATVVFASASIPLDTLRAYAAQLEGQSGALVFRGAPGGLKQLEPFARLARSILAVDRDCAGLDCAMRPVPILIDPILFEANGVTQVPAVAQIRKDLFAQHCDDPEGIRARSTHITYGDAALSGHLAEHVRLDALAAAMTKHRNPTPLSNTGDDQ